MKRFLGLILVIVVSLLIANHAFAVSIGNNKGAARILVFIEEGLSAHDDWDTGSAGLEVITGDNKIIDEGAGPSGLHSITAKERIKIFSNSGTLLFRSPWMELTTHDLYDPTTGALNCQAGPPYGGAPCVFPDDDGGSDDGWYGGGGIADYSGDKYLVIGTGFRAESAAEINDTTHHNEFRIWVVDLTTRDIVSERSFRDNDNGEIEENDCEVKDFDGDGNDDLIIRREREHATNPAKSIKTVYVYDLVTKVRTAKFEFTVFDQ